MKGQVKWLVKIDFSYSCAAADKISTDLSAHAVSLLVFLVAADAFCQSFCRFFGVATANSFSSESRNDANVTG